MPPDKLHRYRETLLEWRQRVTGEVNHVVQAIQEDMNVSENMSNAPVHLADVVSESVDADVHVLETERGILEEINAALDRIDAGTFGACESCGTAIAEERLKAIPYTPVCVRCASAEE